MRLELCTISHHLTVTRLLAASFLLLRRLYDSPIQIMTLEHSSIGQHDPRSLSEDIIHTDIDQGTALHISRVELLSYVFLKLISL